MSNRWLDRGKRKLPRFVNVTAARKYLHYDVTVERVGKETTLVIDCVLPARSHQGRIEKLQNPRNYQRTPERCRGYCGKLYRHRKLMIFGCPVKLYSRAKYLCLHLVNYYGLCRRPKRRLTKINDQLLIYDSKKVYMVDVWFAPGVNRWDQLNCKFTCEEY